jgi:hypothetical protein
LGVGVGGFVLIGASQNHFALQPLALSGSTGIGAAGGVTYLTLEAAEM